MITIKEKAHLLNKMNKILKRFSVSDEIKVELTVKNELIPTETQLKTSDFERNLHITTINPAEETLYLHRILFEIKSY